jgi:hypothetical protein
MAMGRWLALLLLGGCGGGAGAVSGPGGWVEIDLPGAGGRYPIPQPSASLRDTRNGGAAIIQSLLIVTAEMGNQLGCDFPAVRFGPDPFAVGDFTLGGDLQTMPTPAGTAAPMGELTIGIGANAWHCGPGTCGGVVLHLTRLDATSMDGSLTGAFQNGAGASGIASCAFSLTWSDYQP